MKPDVQDMMVFMAVVEARSFTGASIHLGRTKSAISQTISRLESDMDTRLLLRSTRSLTLTDAGAQFYDSCANIKHAYDTALDNFWEDTTDPQGNLSLTAPHALCGDIVAPVIKQYFALYPKMHVRLIAEDASVKIIEEHIDVAIRVGHPDGQTARITKVGTLTESLYAHPEYIAAQGGVPDDLAQLANWDHLANEWQGNPVTLHIGKNIAFKVKPRARCNTMPDILRLTQSGLGVARLPDLTAASGIANNTLIPIAPLSETPIYAIHQFSNKPPKKVRQFIKLVRKQIAISTPG